jgi:hypothetical protein
LQTRIEDLKQNPQIIHYFIATKNINKKMHKKRSYQIHNLVVEIL